MEEGNCYPIEQKKHLFQPCQLPTYFTDQHIQQINGEGNLCGTYSDYVLSKEIITKHQHGFITKCFTTTNLLLIKRLEMLISRAHSILAHMKN